MTSQYNFLILLHYDNKLGVLATWIFQFFIKMLTEPNIKIQYSFVWFGSVLIYKNQTKPFFYGYNKIVKHLTSKICQTKTPVVKFVCIIVWYS